MHAEGRPIRRSAVAAAAVAAAVVLQGIGALPAAACTCVPEPRSAQYERATDVFLAEVGSGPEGVAGARTPVPEGATGGPPATRQVQYRLEVKETFKGAAEGAVRVATSSDAAACGVVFEKGKTYLVFATLARTTMRDTGATPSPDTLQTDICMGTLSGGQLDAAVGEVRALSAKTVTPSDSE
jgi:hypothetical protein